MELAGVDATAKLGANGVHQRWSEQTRKRRLAVDLRQAVIGAVAHVIAGRLIIAAHVVGHAHVMAGHGHSRFWFRLSARGSDRQKAERQSKDRGEDHTHRDVIRTRTLICHGWLSVSAASRSLML